MKNKKTFVGLFVIIALLCLGIGYAAISKTLIIDGGVATGAAEDLADNFILYFTKVEVNTDSANGATVTANVNEAEKSLSTSFSIKNMNKVGSTVVLTYTVKNASEDLYANSPTIYLNSVAVNANEAITAEKVGVFTPCFAITVTPNMVNGQAAPNSTHTITIIIQMTSTPLDETMYDFELSFVYEASQIPYTS